MKPVQFGIASLLLSLVGNHANASVITVFNSGFETPSFAGPITLQDFTRPNGFGSGGFPVADPMPGWTFLTPFTQSRVGGVTRLNPATNFPIGGIPEGENVGYLNDGAVVGQVLSDVLTADTTYFLEVDVGRRSGTLSVQGYTVQLLARGTLLGEDTSVDPAGGDFATATVAYNATSADPLLGQPLEIRLRGVAGGTQVNFDNVRLEANAVPEPSMIALWSALGLGGVYYSSKRKRIKGFGSVA